MYSIHRSGWIGRRNWINIEKGDTSFAHHLVTVRIEELHTLKERKRD
jgi:hypothetical protein